MYCDYCTPFADSPRQGTGLVGSPGVWHVPHQDLETNRVQGASPHRGVSGGVLVKVHETLRGTAKQASSIPSHWSQNIPISHGYRSEKVFIHAKRSQFKQCSLFTPRAASNQSSSMKENPGLTFLPNDKAMDTPDHQHPRELKPA